MRRSKLSPEADADLSAIHSYIFDQDPATAALAIDRIEATIESLCVFPQIGKQTTRPNTWVFGGTGKSPFRVTYRFDEEVLIVLRIFRHSRENVLT